MTKRGGANTIVVCAIMLGGNVQPAFSDVGLELRPQLTTLAVGRVLEVGLYAVSKNNTTFTTIDVVLSWDSPNLHLLEVVNDGPHGWFLFGLIGDSRRDALNNSLFDGDAFFQAVSFSPFTATASGALVGTIRFEADADGAPVNIQIEPQLGLTSITKILQPGAVDVTGSLGATTVEVASEVFLFTADMTVLSGFDDQIVVDADVEAVDASDVTIVVELVPRKISSGASFTPAPATDIEFIDHPWIGSSVEAAQDTDITGDVSRNGATIQAVPLVAAPVTFSGSLAAFPITTTDGACGQWDVRLCNGRCALGDDISWWSSAPDPLPTALDHAVLTVVHVFGDGDCNLSVDARDFSDFQACFSGPGNSFDTSSSRRCAAYDFDNDLDVDGQDLRAFNDATTGPLP